MKYLAKCMFVRMSPTKVHGVARTVGGCSVGEALSKLRFLHNRAARLIESVILSAKSNAEDLGVRDATSLSVKSVSIGSGPTLKRMQPHARGVGFMIKKRTLHVFVELQDSNA